MSIVYVPYHLDEHLTDLGSSLPDLDAATDVSVELPDADVWSRLGRLYDSVADVVERTVRAGSVPAVVSGDCTVSIGVAAGLQRAGIEPSIVWFDAHGDLQTLETTASGYLGGMALRLVLGYRIDLVGDDLGLSPLPAAQVLLVGARDLDPPEVDYLASAPVRRSSVDDLSADSLPDGPLLVNLDLDVLDPVHLPGLRYPATGGPDVAALRRATRTVFGSGRVVALNLACTWRPGQDDVDGIRRQVVSAVLADLRDRPIE